MLPCAEDLGTVPDCSEKVLKEFGIPGINVQRWEKKWKEPYDFIDPGEFRINSVAMVSTDDSSSFPAWWENEAGNVEENLFKRTCEKVQIMREKYKLACIHLFD